MSNVLVIGIAGGSGSGKTTLTNQIAAKFPEEVTVIKHDNYYKKHDEMSYEERSRLNRSDDPGSEAAETGRNH